MSPMRMDRVEAGVRVVMAFAEAFNRRDVPAMLELMSDGCVLETFETAPAGERLIGKPAITSFWQGYFTCYPQAHLKIEEAFGFGYRCIMLWRTDWTDVDGQLGHTRGVDIFRVQDGLIHEQLSYHKG
jgi:ketosteroid isomerase-like protein